MIISNSEVETFNSCERHHYYKFALGLKPETERKEIRLGNIGHAVLEAYYRQGLETDNRKTWYEAAINAIQGFLDECVSEEDIDLVSIVQTRFHQYINFYNDRSWKIIDVEGQYEVKLSDDINYGLRLDLLIQETAGPNKDQFIVIDHKFISRFYSEEELRMNAQIPKYIYTLKMNGVDVRFGILNQLKSIRTALRDNSKLFQRAQIRPTTQRMAKLIHEQELASILINKRLSESVAKYGELARRSISKMNCGNCPFNSPCSMSLDGRFDQEQRLLSLNYRRNDYGYRNYNS